jgi:hypothetical protein
MQAVYELMAERPCLKPLLGGQMCAYISLPLMQALALEIMAVS